MKSECVGICDWRVRRRVCQPRRHVQYPDCGGYLMWNVATYVNTHGLYRSVQHVGTAMTSRNLYTTTPVRKNDGHFTS